MNKIFLKISIVFLLLTLSSCSNVGVFGTSGISGSEVKSDLMDLARMNNIFFCSDIESYSSTCVSFFTFIDGVIVPGLAGIKSSQNYTQESVNKCKKDFQLFGVLFGNPVGALTCKLEKVPQILHLGPLKL